MSNVAHDNHISFDAADHEIRQVGIEDLADVIAHTITKESSNTIHEIEFQNQGKCRLVFTNQGKVKELYIDHMGIIKQGTNAVILRKHDC